jgi:acyl-activating enzyme 14
MVQVLVVLGSGGDGSNPESSAEEAAAGIEKQYHLLHAEKLINEQHAQLNNTKNSTLPLKQPSDGAAFLIFTSGTTGPPRAAVLSHAALHFQCNAKLRCCGYNKADIYLHTAQLFHVGGLCSALAMLLAGAQHVFLPIFRATDCLKAIEMYSVTSFIAVPTMISDLLAANDSGFRGSGGSAPVVVEQDGRKEEKMEFLSVQSVLVGAGGLSQQQNTRLHDLIPNATIYSAYGMTEGCSSLTFSTLAEHFILETKNNNGGGGDHSGGVYVGCPPPGIELAILPASSTTIIPSPPINNKMKISKEGYGEIITRGPHTMLGYWNDPEATFSAFLPPLCTENTTTVTTTKTTKNLKWMRTGDLGYLRHTTSASTTNQQPLLWLVGRAKDVIRSGGENVSAAEVERALQTHPAVDMAVVVGLPDQRLGERVAAVIVLNSGYTWQGSKDTFSMDSSTVPGNTSSTNNNRTTSGTISAVLLQQHCRVVAGLAGFKVPRIFFLLDNEGEMPRNATGKVVKAQLKEICIKKIASSTTMTVVPNMIKSRL